MNEYEFAAGLFTGLTGEAPPRPRPWKLIARRHSGDRNQALYEVDRERWIVHLNLHEGQMRAWESDARFVFMLAGTQGGKTSFEPWWLARRILELEQPGDHLAVAPTFDIYKLKLLPMMLEIFVDVLDIGYYWAGDQVLELRNPITGEFEAERSSDKMWGRIILRSASATGGLEAATALDALLDECGQKEFGYDAWLATLRRLSLARGPIIAGTTLYNLGWLKQKVFDPWERKDPLARDIDVIQFPSILNPRFSREEFEERRLTMQDHEFRMQYEGKFGRPAAAIFQDFINLPRHEGGHLVGRFEIPREWARYQSVDPGIIHTAKLWAAHDPGENVYYVYRSTMHARKPATEHARDDLALEAQLGERVVLRAIGAKSEKYWREDYRAAGAEGIREPDVDDVEEGIDRVVTLLKQHRVYFMDDLVDLIGEILEYAREVDDMGQATDKIANKSTFHRVDTIRYLAVQLVKRRLKMQDSSGAQHYA